MIILSDPPEDLKKLVQQLYGTNEESKEQDTDQRNFCKIKTKEDLVESCCEVLNMVPPFRNFTTRLFCRLILQLQPDF